MDDDVTVDDVIGVDDVTGERTVTAAGDVDTAQLNSMLAVDDGNGVLVLCV